MRKRRHHPRARVRRPIARRNFDLDADVLFEDRAPEVDGCEMGVTKVAADSK